MFVLEKFKPVQPGAKPRLGFAFKWKDSTEYLGRWFVSFVRLGRISAGVSRSPPEPDKRNKSSGHFSVASEGVNPSPSASDPQYYYLGLPLLETMVLGHGFVYWSFLFISFFLCACCNLSRRPVSFFEKCLRQSSKTLFEFFLCIRYQNKEMSS